MTTAKECFDLIAKMDQMDLKVLGSTETSQKTYVYMYLTRALRELAHIAYWTKYADPKTITADGDQTFVVNGQPIDMYAPLRLLGPDGYETVKRSSYAASPGWWRESNSQPIHTKGLNGTYTLHYVAFPSKVTQENDLIEFPEPGIMVLIFWTISLIKQSRNAYAEAKAMRAEALEALKITVLSNESARGRSSGGFVPSLNEVNMYYKF